jgi:hypothetical protein
MSSQALRNLAAGGLLLAAGSALGWWMRDRVSTGERGPLGRDLAARPEPRRADGQGAHTVNHVSIQSVDTAAVRAAVREAVSEELARARADAAAETDAEKADAEQPSLEVQAKLDSGHQYIESAIAAGRWGSEQAGYVRNLGLGMTGEQYQELVRPIVIAINAGRLELSGDETPF